MRERVDYERPSAFVRRRGTFIDKREKVYAGVPETLPPLGDDQMPNRLGLARWLVQPQNPLTARVAVNRALGAVLRPRSRRDERGLRHAGDAAVTSGTARLARHGARARGWHMKAIHKLIVTVRDLSAVVSSDARAGRARSRQPAARARAALPDGRGDGARHGARRQRALEPENRRAQRVSSAARRHLGHPIQRREVEDRATERTATAAGCTCSSAGRLPTPASSRSMPRAASAARSDACARTRRSRR